MGELIQKNTERYFEAIHEVREDAEVRYGDEWFPFIVDVFPIETVLEYLDWEKERQEKNIV